MIFVSSRFFPAVQKGVCAREGWDNLSVYADAYNWKYDADANQLVCQRGPYGKDWHGNGDIRIPQQQQQQQTQANDVLESDAMITIAQERDNSPATDSPRDIGCDQSVCLCDAEFAMCLRAHKDAFRPSHVHRSFYQPVVHFVKKLFGY